MFWGYIFVLCPLKSDDRLGESVAHPKTGLFVRDFAINIETILVSDADLIYMYLLFTCCFEFMRFS